MESLLNLVWVLVSLACGGAALAHSLRWRHRRHSLAAVILAWIIVSVLLFPVISVTDDLNPVLFTAEDATRRMQAVHQLAVPAITTVLFLSVALFLAALVPLGTLESDHPLALTRDGLATALSGRAPPAFS